MIWPPSLLGISIRLKNRVFGLWLPLFLVWPLGFALVAILAPFVLVLAALLWPLGWARTLLLTGLLLFRLFCSLRGLEVNVEKSSEQVLISSR